MTKSEKGSIGDAGATETYPRTRRVRYANPEDAKLFELTVIADHGPQMEAEDMADGDYIEPAGPDLAADLARVTAERDELLAAVQEYAEASCEVLGTEPDDYSGAPEPYQRFWKAEDRLIELGKKTQCRG